MKKRILSLFLTAALCVGMLPEAAWAVDETHEESGTQSDTYVIDEDTQSRPAAQTGETPAVSDVESDVENCSHSSVTTAEDSTVTCDDCGAQMVAVTDRGTYYADVADALNNATNVLNGNGEAYITLLTDTSTKENINIHNSDTIANNDEEIVFLHLAGHKLTCSGEFSVGKEAPDPNDDPNTNITLSFEDSGSVDASINVKYGGDLTLNQWGGGTIKSVTVETGGGFASPDFGTIETLQLNGSDTKRLGTIKLGGGQYGDIFNNTGEDLTLGDLLLSHYIGHTTDGEIVKHSDTLANRDHIYDLTLSRCTTHIDDGNGRCIYCNRTISLSVASVTSTKGDITYYENFTDAFAAANFYDTVTLLDNVELAEPLNVSVGANFENFFTLDLNGKTISCNNGASDTLFVSAKLTICDSSSEKTGKITKNANFAVRVGSGGTLTVTGGSFEMLCVNTQGSAKISGGTFDYITSDNGSLADLLKTGYAFQDSEGNLVNGYTTTKATNVTVVPHTTHNGSSCACGYTCDHSSGMDSTTGLCKDCGEQLAIASVKAGETTSYYTDIHAAFDAVKVSNGGTLTLLSDVTLPSWTEDYDHSSIYLSPGNSIQPYVFTIDWNGHTISGNPVSNLLVLSGRTSVTLKDSSGRNTGGVHSDYGTAVCLSLDGYEQTVTIEGGTYFPQVTKYNCTGNVKISGGVFVPQTGSRALRSIYRENADGTLADLLADGVTFAYEDENDTKTPFDVYSTYCSESGKTVYVIPHTHEFGENNKCVCGYTCPHTTVDADNKCTLCGKQMAASVASNGSVVYYDTLSAALDKVGSGSTLKLLKDFASEEPISISKGSSVFYLDLNGHTVDTLTISSYTKLMDTAENGSIGNLTCSDNFLGATLASGWSFKKGSKIWLDADDLFRNSATTVSVAQAQITGVAARSGDSVPFGSDATVEAIPLPGDFSVLSYQWYESIGGTWVKIVGANSSTYTSNTLSLGNHYFTCAVTGADGATVLSGGGSATITQASIENATVNVIAPTYNGNAQTPEVTVTLNSKPLTADDYDVTVEEQTNAGTYALTITGKGNYTGTIENIPWKIEPKTVANVSISVAPCTYNGQEQKPDVELKDGTTVIPENEYTVEYSDNINAGNGTVTIKAKDGGNYKFGPQDGMSLARTFTIDKADAPSDVPASMTVVNNFQTTYLVDLPTLPTLPNGCQYGNIDYEADEFALTGGYSNSMATITSENQFQLNVPEVPSTDEGPCGTVKVKVTTENYQDFYIVFSVTAKNKITPVADGEVTASAITYGQMLYDSTITGKMKDPTTGAAVEGTFDWDNGRFKPQADNGEYRSTTADWVFTPTGVNAGRYTTATGATRVVVNKAQFTNVSVQQDGTLTYNGQPQRAAVKTAATLIDGADATFQYSAVNGIGVSYYFAVPAFTEAGEHTVYYLVSDVQQNHEYFKGEFTVTIDPKTVADPTIELTGDQTYTGKEIKPAVTVKDGETVIPGTEYEVIYTNNTAAGTATVTLKNKDGGNYIVSGSTTFEISKADSAVATAPTANALTYNGTEQALVTAGEANGGKMMYSLTENGEYTENIPSGKDAKTYTVWYKVAGDGNHNDTAPQSVEVTVAKASVTVAVKNKSAYTGSTAPDLSKPVQDTDYTVSGLFGEDTLTGTVTLAYDGTPDMTKTGETAIKITGTLENENYTVSYVDGKLTVSTRPSSGHGSSSSSSSTISASKSDNGSVSLDKSSASKGSTVTVTVKAKDGYKLDKLTISDAKGNTIEVTDKGDGKFSFVMPDGKVTVTPTFVADNGGQTESKSFNDVQSGDWYADAVQYVSDKGLMSGTGSGKFAPNDTTTRAMLMTVLARYAGEDTTGGTTWYEKGMNWAKANGVSDGTNPNGNITREQLITMLYRYAGSPATDGKLDSFTDSASVSIYAVNAMRWAAANGIVNGSNGKLNPQNNATRAEVAAILMRFCEMSK